MQIIFMAREVQIPLLAALLLGGCAAKLVRAFRAGSMDAGLGPTALFPVRLRRPVALAMSAVELGLGIGLIATAGPSAWAPPADLRPARYGPAVPGRHLRAAGAADRPAGGRLRLLRRAEPRRR